MVPPTEVESRAKPPRPYNCQCSAPEAVAGTGTLSALGARSTPCRILSLFADGELYFVLLHSIRRLFPGEISLIRRSFFISGPVRYVIRRSRSFLSCAAMSII